MYFCRSKPGEEHFSTSGFIVKKPIHFLNGLWVKNPEIRFVVNPMSDIFTFILQQDTPVITSCDIFKAFTCLETDVANEWLNGITEVVGNIKCHHGELEIT